ncbi:MAG: HAD family phosphatase [Chlamydiae bacterium]|nr:HAD family phosphatase [Chlamydiota bacterium]
MVKNILQRTVFFDLGNVILLFCHQKMCSNLAEVCGLPLETIQTALLKSHLGDLYERGLLNDAQLHQKICEQFSIDIHPADFFQAMSDIFTLNEPIVPIIEELKKNGIELILLSNTCPAHFNYALKNYPILQLFDKYVLSYEVGARKPEPEIFLHALSLSSSEIKNCFYTDDIEEFVKSAKTLGIDAHTFTTTTKLSDALLVRDFLKKPQV